MSNPRNENETQELVSVAYREIASERAPEHLNQTILRQAAAEGKPAFAGRFPGGVWMRPVAWTAIIALSLAIVLELSEIQSVSTLDPAISSPAPASRKIIPPDASVLPDAADNANDPLDPVQQEIRQNKPVPAAGSPVQNDKAKLEAPAASAEFSKLQPAVHPDARARAESTALPMARKATSVQAGCDAATRESPEAWVQCIQSLRDSGRDEQADLEYNAFVARYPPD